MSRLRDPDIRLGAFLIAVAALWTFVLVPIGIGSPGRVAMIAVAPSFWPVVCGIALMALGAAVALRGWLRGGRAAPPDDRPVGAQDVFLPLPVAVRRVGAAGAIIVAYYLTVEPLGMPLASGLAFLALCLLAGERRYGHIGAIAVGLPIALTLFFIRVASVPIPLGVAEGLF